jgi:Flp pilus assembly protein TadG
VTARLGRRGAAAVEFAITLPLFLLCTIGAFDLVWLIYQRNTLVLALEDACRAVALGDPGADLGAEVDAALDRSFAELGLAACTDCAGSASVVGAAPSRRLTCAATRTVRPLTGYLLGDSVLEVDVSVWMERQSP